MKQECRSLQLNWIVHLNRSGHAVYCVSFASQVLVSKSVEKMMREHNLCPFHYHHPHDRHLQHKIQSKYELLHFTDLEEILSHHSHHQELIQYQKGCLPLLLHQHFMHKLALEDWFCLKKKKEVKHTITILLHIWNNNSLFLNHRTIALFRLALL